MAIGGSFGLIGKILIASFIDRYHSHVRWFAAGVLLVKVVGLAVLLTSGPYFN